MPNKRHNPWRRPQRLIIALANNIFKLSALGSSLFQNGLPINCRDVCLSVSNKWFLRHTKGFDNEVPLQYLPSLLTVLLISISLFLYYCPITQGVSFSWLQCLQYKDPCKLTCFGWYPRTGVVVVKELCHRWGPGVGEKGLFLSIPIPLLTMIAANAESWYSRIRE